MLTARKQILIALVLIVLASGSGFVSGVVFDRQVLVPQVIAHSIQVPAGATNDFKLMVAAWNTIQKNYVDRSALQNQKDLTYGAVSGMVDALGDTGHSRFMTPEMIRSEQSLTTGQFEGIGAEVQMKAQQVVVVAPFPGSPAEKAGIKPGDIILRVNGKDVTGQSLEDVVSQIVGPAGTTVHLTIMDPTTQDTRELTVTRAKIALRDVTWGMVPGTTIADIHINEFSKGVTPELKNILQSAQSQGATGLILDLRSDPGGLLDEAVGVASQFLKDGDVLKVKDAAGKITEIKVNPGGVALDIPMVVLINQGTASASEIVSGALQDARRARLVGETTLGTGTVLGNFPLPGNTALLLATGEWLTPNGRVIWHQGILPDETVKLSPSVIPVFPLDGQTLPAQNANPPVEDTQYLHALQDLISANVQSP
jgi:carboxyl-terminal processing protease